MPAKKSPPKSVGRKPSRRVSARAPKSSRPVMPPVYGIPATLKGSLPWNWACDRLTNSHNYLLAANANCIVCNENVEEEVIVEGQARQLAVPDIPEKAFALYLKKYGWKLDPEMGPIFKVTPRVVFAMPEKRFPLGATRWLFE